MHVHRPATGGSKIFHNRAGLAKKPRFRDNFAMSTTYLSRLCDDGFVVIPAVFPAAQIDTILGELAAAFANDLGKATLRAADGSIYGARNLLQLWPDLANVWRREPLPELLS